MYKDAIAAAFFMGGGVYFSPSQLAPNMSPLKSMDRSEEGLCISERVGRTADFISLSTLKD